MSRALPEVSSDASGGEEISQKNFVVEGSEEVPSFDCGFKFEFVHYLTGFIQQAIAPFYL